MAVKVFTQLGDLIGYIQSRDTANVHDLMRDRIEQIGVICSVFEFHQNSVIGYNIAFPRCPLG